MLYSRKAQLALIATVAITTTPGCECEPTTTEKSQENNQQQQEQQQQQQQQQQQEEKMLGGKTEQQWKQEVIDAKEKNTKIGGQTKDEIVQAAQMGMVKEEAKLNTDLQGILALLGIDLKTLANVDDGQITTAEGEVDKVRIAPFIAQYNNYHKLHAVVKMLKFLERKSFVKRCDPTTDADIAGNGTGTNKYNSFARTCLKMTTADILNNLTYEKCSAGKLEGDKFSCTTPTNGVAATDFKLTKTEDALTKFVEDEFAGLHLSDDDSNASRECAKAIKEMRTQQVKGDVSKINNASGNCTTPHLVGTALDKMFPGGHVWTQPASATDCSHAPAGEILIGLAGLVKKDSDDAKVDKGYDDGDAAKCVRAIRYLHFSRVMDAVAEDLNNVEAMLASIQYVDGKTKTEVQDKQKDVDALREKRYEKKIKEGLALAKDQR